MPASRKHVHATLCTVTPPRTPTAPNASAHDLLSEVQTIYDAVSALPNLAPGEPINTLLTRLVNLCIMPYNEDFIAYFRSISGVQKLCELTRSLCAIAEGNLEAYWACRLLREASQGTLTSTSHQKFQTLIKRNMTSDLQPPHRPPHLPLLPELHRSLRPRMLSPYTLPLDLTHKHRFHRLRPTTAHFILPARSVP
jgi:hypothetical protein